MAVTELTLIVFFCSLEGYIAKSVKWNANRKREYLLPSRLFDFNGYDYNYYDNYVANAAVSGYDDDNADYDDNGYYVEMNEMEDMPGINADIMSQTAPDLKLTNPNVFPKTRVTGKIKKWLGKHDPKYTFDKKRGNLFGYEVKTLYHSTNRKAGASMKKQCNNKFPCQGILRLPIEGMFGIGIYFAYDQVAAHCKANHKGNIITADVVVGKSLEIPDHTCPKKQPPEVKDWSAWDDTNTGCPWRIWWTELDFAKMQEKGYDSAHLVTAHSFYNGAVREEGEVIVYNNDQIMITSINDYDPPNENICNVLRANPPNT